MKTTLIVITMLLVATFATADHPKPNLEQDDAQKIALKSEKGAVENEDNIVTNRHTDYSFDIKTEKDICVVVVNGDTGKIVSDKTETADELESKKKKKPCVAMTGVTKTGITMGCTDTPKK
jgi:hypothetical protein